MGSVLIDSFPDLKAAARTLAGAERYYLDTEFETSRRERGLCLIQVSRGEDVYLVDTIRLTALEPLAEAIARPDAEWVLHDGSQDLGWLRRALKFKSTPRLFDTQVAWGLIGPEYPVSLAYLVYKILGIRSGKEQQAGDWTSRPLSKEQLDYAADDVAHLPEIRMWLVDRLKEKTRETIVGEVSGEVNQPHPPEPVCLGDFRNAWQLDASGLAVLKHLIEWYNALPDDARAEAPWPKTFFDIARLLPESGSELGRVRGMPWEWAKRHGDKFAGNLIRVSAAASKAGAEALEPPPYNTFERILADGWMQKAIAEVSTEAGIAPELAFPGGLRKGMLKAVEEKSSREEAAARLTGWRETLLREPFLKRCVL